MGNDDNTPLVGVTGGGLPAEIWHEVMTGVEAGIPPTPLPMITPEMMPPPVFPDQGAPADSPTIQRKKPRPQDPAGNLLLDVLGAILGKRQ